jgi:hypothetical protein
VSLDRRDGHYTLQVSSFAESVLCIYIFEYYAMILLCCTTMLPPVYRLLIHLNIFYFRLGSLQASANLIKLALHGLALPVSLGPDIPRCTVGGIARLPSFGEGPAPDVNPIAKKRKKGFFGKIASVFTPALPSSGSVSLHGLPDNITTLKLAMSLFEHLSVITLMHGSTPTSQHHLRYCIAIKVKICDLLALNREYIQNSSSSFIDRIIDPEEGQEVEDETMLRYCRKYPLSIAGQALKAISCRASGGGKKAERRPHPVLDSIAESRDYEDEPSVPAQGRGHGLHSPDVFGSPTSVEEHSGSVYSLSSVSYEQTTPGATPETLSSSKYSGGTPNTDNTNPTNLKGQYIERNGRNAAVVFDQAVILVDKALLDASKAEFKTGMLCLRRASVLLGCLGDEVGGASRQFVHLYQAWCYFVCGNVSKSNVLLEVISKFVSVFEQSTLYKWAIELKALKMVVNGTGYASSMTISDLITNLREILKTDKPSACSSAIMAMSYAIGGQPLLAVTHARYAILKLSQRDAVTFVAPLFIFIAGYAAAIAMEAYIDIIILSSTDALPVYHSEPIRNLYSDFDDNEEKLEESWITEARKKSYKAMRRVEFADECVSMAQKRLRSVYKTSQPCMVQLYRALKIKHLICNAVLNKTVSKLPYSHLMSDIKTSDYNDFVFGYSFLRLEKVRLSAIYNAEKQLTKEASSARENELREIAQMFSTIGCQREKLKSFGLFRFSADALVSAFNLQVNAHYLSLSYSNASSRGMGSSQSNAEGYEDNPDDLLRISRIVQNVQHFRPVNVEDFKMKDAHIE